MGGLGIPTMKARNQALLSKFRWRLIKGEKTVWAEALRKKYSDVDKTNPLKRSRGSRVLKAISHGDKVIQKGLKRLVRSGENINVWWEDWTGLGALRGANTGVVKARSGGTQSQGLFFKFWSL